jgi:hypothetical protein
VQWARSANASAPDARYDRDLLHWLDAKESEVQPVLLAKLQQLVNAVVADRSHYPSSVVHQAQIIDQVHSVGAQSRTGARLMAAFDLV